MTRRKQAQGPQDQPETDGTVWVSTQASASGRTYVVTVGFSDDLSTTLKPLEAAEYARYVLAAGMRAAHDAAVFAQLDSSSSTSLEHIAVFIDSIRQDRPALRCSLTPVRLEPGVNAHGEPFVRVGLTTHTGGGAGDVEWVGQWNAETTRSHAIAILEAVAAADLDAGYYRHLLGKTGFDEEQARYLVADLHHRMYPHQSATDQGSES